MPPLQTETMRLNGNVLTGTFPATLGNMLSLEILDIGDNLLTGAIPPNVLSNFGLLSKYAIATNLESL